MTLGSRPAEHARRRDELERSCAALGFECRYPFEDLSGGFLRASGKEPARKEALDRLAILLEELEASIVLAPHLGDAHPTHVLVGEFVRETIQSLKNAPRWYIETEFWATMAEPNCLVEAAASDLGALVRALAEHEGEVRRNPYHLTLPAWMEDSARRGAELVGGFGTSSAPPFRFASAYRVCLADSGIQPVLWEKGPRFSERFGPG